MLFLLNTEKLMGWKRHKQFLLRHWVISIMERMEAGWLGRVSNTLVTKPGHQVLWSLCHLDSRSLSFSSYWCSKALQGDAFDWFKGPWMLVSLTQQNIMQSGAFLLWPWVIRTGPLLDVDLEMLINGKAFSYLQLIFCSKCWTNFSFLLA